MTDADKIVIKAEAIRTAYNACMSGVQDCKDGIDYLEERLKDEPENTYTAGQIEEYAERMHCLETIAKAIIKL